MTEISKTFIDELKKLFSIQIENGNYDSVYWVKGIHYSDRNQEFVVRNKDKLNIIFDYNDNEITHKSDILEVYLCKRNTKRWELVLVASPYELYANDQVVGVFQIDSLSDTQIEEYKLEQIW
jgi:hypothetical protein